MSLPLPSRAERARARCPADSPFSIQIAAIDQVEPDGDPSASLEDRALLRALADSGACWARVGVNWAAIEPEPPEDRAPPEYKWLWYDRRLGLVAGTGVRLIGLVHDVPEWARGEPYPDLRCTSIRPDRLDEFARFLTDLVNHYKRPPWNIHHWELFNEPDGTTRDRATVGQGCAGYRGEHYAQMLAMAYPAIKAADPTATVLLGGLAYDGFTEYDGPFYRYFADELMAAGGADSIDGVTFHYFTDFRAEWERWTVDGPLPTCGEVEDDAGAAYEAGGIDLIAKTNHLRNRLSTCWGVNKPIWVTELAEHGYPGDPVSLAQQARYVIQGTVRGLAAGVQNITWFALITPSYDPAEQGLLYRDRTPKPAYTAYQTLTSELAGWTYAYTLNLPEGEAYVFRNAAQQEKTVAWGKGTLAFAPASWLRVVDRHGTATMVEDGGVGDVDGQRNGSIRLRLSPDSPGADPEPEPFFISMGQPEPHEGE